MKITILTAFMCLFNLGVASAQTLSEGEIAGVIQAVNNAEIKISGLASGNTTTTGVMSFGSMIVADHTANNTGLRALFTGKGNMILTSVASDAVDARAALSSDALSAMKDKTFDTAYLDNQIQLDQDVLAVIDGYMPQVTRPAFSQFLVDTRALIAQHLEAAKILRDADVEPTPTPVPSPSPIPSPSPAR